MINFKKSGRTNTIKLDLSSQLRQQMEWNDWGLHTVAGFSVKLAVMALAPLGLVFYERYNEDNLLKQKEQVAGELSDRKQKLKTLTDKLASYDGAHKKNEEFQNKLGILKTLAQERVMVIRVLDSIQEAMGRASEQENVSEFIFFNTVNVRGDRLTIAGSASKEDVIDQFVEKLQGKKTIYHSINWEDVVSNQQTKIKNFRITGEIINNKGT